jgi:predicted hydrolase (HD superfamily)
MTITRSEAWQQLEQWTQSHSLLKHAQAVEIVMRQAAYRYGNGQNEEEKWGIAGLLHDADYEKWPNEHPKLIVAWLREHEAHDIAHAISAHYTKWQVTYETNLDKALLACDELTGFIVACARVRPEGITTLNAKSVIKKLKDKAFAAKVEREEIFAGVELLGVDINTHIQFIIEALTPHAITLEIGGRELSE